MQSTVGKKFLPIVTSDLVNPHNNPKKKELSSRPFSTYQRHPTDRLAQVKILHRFLFPNNPILPFSLTLLTNDHIVFNIRVLME